MNPTRPLLILASASPRRIDMLKAAAVPHAVHPTNVDETPELGEPPERLVLRVSQAKADAAAPRYPEQPVLGADTVVFAGDATLGKPEHEGAARQMLRLLSGRTHRVLTGYHLRCRGASGELVRLARIVETEVDVQPLTEGEISGYLRSEEWRGKAGSYAIQGRFACFVRAVRGSYESVVGLPLCQVIEDLREAGVLDPEWPQWKA